jgi:hypothetical protein
MANDQEPDLLWSPIAAALVLLAPGVLALLTGRLLLFPSLAPSAVLQAHRPNDPTSRPYHVVVSHLVGMGAAMLLVWTLGLSNAPSVFELHRVGLARMAAAVLAIALGTLLELLLRASHAPAASTTLLVALGSFPPTWGSAGLITGGVLATVVAGEAARRLRLAFTTGKG